MKRMQVTSIRSRLSKVLALSVAALLLVAGAHADLFSYVKRPEPESSWKLEEKIEHEKGTVYSLHLVSQNWQGIRWEHQLQVYRPKGAAPAATMLLMNTGGSADDGDMAFGMQLAGMVGAPCAVVYQIPNQPLFGDKTEDTLIAETFVRYLDTEDENWPLLFPMVKSVVKAMDALQEFTKQEWNKPVEQFVITGGSKRGWTSWLTGADDPRVKAIAPLVIDTLNMRRQMDHQFESFGAYSDQIRDYTERKLVPIPDTAAADRLWRMVDPYTYRDRLTLPKLIINGNNDPYWSTDALNLYWDDLKGEKWVHYVPNAGHGLEQQHENGEGDRKRALSALAAFARHQIADNPMPTLSWKHDEADGKLRVTAKSEPAPLGARLWIAQAPTRDFRQSKWTERPAQIRESTISETVDPPARGCIAFYLELDYKIGDLPYHLSTQLRIAGKPVE